MPRGSIIGSSDFELARVTALANAINGSKRTRSATGIVARPLFPRQVIVALSPHYRALLRGEFKVCHSERLGSTVTDDRATISQSRRVSGRGTWGSLARTGNDEFRAPRESRYFFEKRATFRKPRTGPGNAPRIDIPGPNVRATHRRFRARATFPYPFEFSLKFSVWFSSIGEQLRNGRRRTELPKR